MTCIASALGGLDAVIGAARATGLRFLHTEVQRGSDVLQTDFYAPSTRRSGTRRERTCRRQVTGIHVRTGWCANR